MEKKTNPQQFGSTEDRSCTQAAFLVSKGMAKSKDQGHPAYIASLDVQKALNVI